MPGIDPQARGFAALHAFLLEGRTVGDSLQHVAQAAADAVDAAAFVGLTMVVDGTRTTGVFTDATSPQIDRAQYDTGRGPCVDSLQTGNTIRIDSTTHDRRYPEFSRAADLYGVRSTLSVPMRAAGTIFGAMNLYSHREHGFDHEVETLVHRFATQAAVVLANAVTYANSVTLTDQMRTALESREAIDLARGIIMCSTRCNGARAFDLLVQQSQQTNTKLRVVAEQIVHAASRAAAS
jgi:GAF domain-containing protein